jgi:AraC family transcriptional activator of mtrCDE
MLMQTRMTQAARWLAHGKRSVGDIGEAVGYQSEAAFNRVFKRCFGVGPGQYRRSARISS